MEKQMKRIDLYRNAEDAMVGYAGFCADKHNDCAECRLFKSGEGVQGCAIRWAMENVPAKENKKIAEGEDNGSR